MTTIAEIIKQAPQLFSESPEVDVELLLLHIIKQPRSYLFSYPEYCLSPTEFQQFRQLLKRREKGEPVAYIIGHCGFWTLDLLVDGSTLIPRPDTELLIEEGLQLSLPNKAQVLDLGTGTGAIALALASERNEWQVIGVDKSDAAIALANKNKQQLSLTNVVFKQSDWFDNIDDEQFDIIVSNPPYIPDNDPHLSQGDVRFEPKSALVAGSNGLADIEFIASHAQQHLKPNGWLLLEHGYDQAEAVREILNRNDFYQVSTKKDLPGNDRVTLGCMVNRAA